MFLRLREKLVVLYEEDPEGYEKDYQGVRQEMRGFLLAVDMMEFWMTLRSEEGRTYEEAYKV